MEEEGIRMMRRGTIATGLRGLLLLLVVTQAGCAGTKALAGRDPGERLRERSRAYWDARRSHDLAATYTLHEPAFRRAVTMTAFAQGRGVTQILEYEILGERIEGDLGIVNVKVKSTFTHAQLVKPVEPSWSEFEEQWVRVDGEWYRKFRFPIGDPYPPVDWNAFGAGGQGTVLPPRR